MLPRGTLDLQLKEGRWYLESLEEKLVRKLAKKFKGVGLRVSIRSGGSGFFVQEY